MRTLIGTCIVVLAFACVEKPEPFPEDATPNAEDSAAEDTGTDTGQTLPPLVCKGDQAPALYGCILEHPEEGCCQGDGKAVYCKEDGNTYCWQCTEGSLCGWQSNKGYYNCDTAGGTDPSGVIPRMCPDGGG